MSDKTMSGTVPARALIAYSAPAIPLSMMMMQLIVYVPPFYAAEMGLDLATVGLVFFLARGWDALIDPVVGNLSDLTRSRWGRRKPWIGIGMPALVILVWAFCQPPSGIGVAYLGIVAFAFYVALTVVQIPYLSWGAELSRDYVQRTRITGFREAGTMLGTILATGLPLLVLRGEDPPLGDILLVFTVAVSILLPVSCVWALKRAPVAPFHDLGRRGLLSALGGVRRNKPMLRLLCGVFLFWLAGAVYNAMVLFMVQFTLELPRSAFLWFVFAQYICAIAALPLAIRLGNSMGRHRALIFGALAFFVLAPLFLLIAKGAFWPALIVFMLMGSVTSFIWVMPPALVADAIEYGMMKGAGDDAALYMALYYFVQKTALAVGVGLALPLAGALGFDPATGQGGPAMDFVAVVMPLLLALPGALVLFNYPIDRRRHATIRRWLARRGMAPLG